MTGLFATVLRLSLLGAALAGLMFVLGPLLGRVSPKGQRRLWSLAALAMVLPLWLCIPPNQARNLLQSATEPAAQATLPPALPTGTPAEAPAATPPPPIQAPKSPGSGFPQLLPCLWLAGTCLFLLLAGGSYVRFLAQLNRGSVALVEPALDELRQELGIRRAIGLRRTKRCHSPLLVGLFFPVIYLPATPLDPQRLPLVLRHELTHYKNRDLPLKWAMLLINAIHWFNPMAYLLSTRLDASCEAACDAAVVASIAPQLRRDYMKAILEVCQQTGGTSYVS